MDTQMKPSSSPLSFIRSKLMPPKPGGQSENPNIKKYKISSPMPFIDGTPPDRTRYTNMFLQLDSIPMRHYILAGLSTWILLAGYVFFPVTFTSLRNSGEMKGAAEKTKQEILNTVQYVPLLWLAAICCGSGALGMSWLWWRWQENYLWLIDRLFLPGMLNSITGFIATIINVYTVHKGSWSITAKLTAIISGVCTGITSVLFLVYNNWLLIKVKWEHDLETKITHD